MLGEKDGFYHPSTEAQLVELVQSAAANDRQVRVRGSSHAVSGAIFTDGISSRREATEYSGRGVGMSAVRQACRDLGGAIDVTSVAGEGTRLIMRFPHTSDEITAAA